MKKADQKDVAAILEYIGYELPLCLYMYLDLTMYSLDEPHMDLWFSEDEDGVCLVVMRYHGTFHIYADRAFEQTDELLALIEAQRPASIFGRMELIRGIEVRLSDSFHAEYGNVLSIDRLKDAKYYDAVLEDCDVQIEIASEKDAADIASLLFLDPDLSGPYASQEQLAAEIAERIRTGMGRSLIIRNASGQVIAHTATYAECARFAIRSGLMVYPDYRKTLYAYWIDCYLDRILSSEGKSIYSFEVAGNVIKLNQRKRIKIVGQYGKMLRKQTGTAVNNG